MSRNISIIYEDNHLLVVEKPPNLLSQEDQTGDPDILSLLKDFIKERDSKPGNVYLGLVHRLDRPVGGVMVLAKTSKAASRLAEQFRNHQVTKRYLAVTRGKPQRLEGVLRHYLLKDSRTNMVRAFPSPQPQAREAVLKYVILASNSGLNLAKIELLTGRAHQIRVQMAAEGLPLWGDQKYDAEQNKPGQQLALWAAKLELSHPTKREPMVFISLPASFHPWDLFSEILTGENL